MNQKISPQIIEAFKKAELRRIKGVYGGHVLLTPNEVTNYGDKRKLRKPNLFEPYGEFLLVPSKGATVLNLDQWKEKGTQKPINIGIFQGGIEFPDSCCKCMSKAEHYKIVEVESIKQSVKFEADISGKEGARIAMAIAADRFWFPIPFCKKHDMKSRALGFVTKGESPYFRLRIRFANQEFGKKFAEINRLTGKWFDKTGAVAKRLLEILWILPLLLLAVGIGGASSKTGITLMNSLETISGLVLGTGLIGFWYKYGRGVVFSGTDSQEPDEAS